ncbi:PD40 domain-containing protein [bacterium]|nr:PD40 domain-containing protein [bacterium]
MKKITYNTKTYTKFITSLLLIIMLLICVDIADAKIYIDIASPGIRQLPIKIITTGDVKGFDLEKIIKSDLKFTGLIQFVDPDISGAEIVVTADVAIGSELTVVLSIQDLVAGKEVLKTRYVTKKGNIRVMGHRAADAIYQIATGQKGVFRTKLTYLAAAMSGKKALRIMDWDGFKSQKLVSRGLISSHSWSMDAKHLFYSAERRRQWKIYSLDLQKSKEAVLFSSKGLNIVGGTSPGGLIAFSSSKDGSSEIYTTDIKSSRTRKLTKAFGIDVSPVFSPDGTNIAFVSDRGGTPQLYIMRADGSNLRRLTYEGNYNTSPAWAPNGKWLSYSSRTNGKNQVFMVKSDGKDLRQLTFDGNNESPSFSPDGMFLAFDSDRDGEKGIYIMRANGEEQKRITPSYMKAWSPKWSPYLY